MSDEPENSHEVGGGEDPSVAEVSERPYIDDEDLDGISGGTGTMPPGTPFSWDTGSACDPEACNSFLGDTPVVMGDGTARLLSAVRPGDLVATRDGLTGLATARPVSGVVTGEGTRHLVSVTTLAGGGPRASEAVAPDRPGTWTATADHLVRVAERGWTRTVDLQIGDRLVGFDGSGCLVSQLRDHGWCEGQTVYNLRVADTSAFVVGSGDNTTLVHDASVSAHEVHERALSAAEETRDVVGSGAATLPG